MINQNQLDTLVAAADPAVSDADLATQLSVATKTPKPERVTYTTCAGVWGSTAAATFQAGMKTAIAAGGAFGILAAFIDTLLAGPGIDPSNAEVPAQSAAFVAAGLATQQQADGVFYLITYPAGDVVAAADVTASRARIAREAAFETALKLAAAQYNAAMSAITQARILNGNPPDDAAVLAMLGTKAGGQA